MAAQEKNGIAGNVSERSDIQQKSDHEISVQTKAPKPDEKSYKGIGSFIELFRYGSLTDKILQSIATIAAAGVGLIFPLMAVSFGHLVDVFDDQHQLQAPIVRASINRFSSYFLYLAIARFTLAYINNTLFAITSTRVTKNVCSRYMRALVHQDITYFESRTPGSLATDASTNRNLVLEGLSEKLGDIITGISQIVGSLVVAFIVSWRLCVVVAPTTLLIIIVASSLMTRYNVAYEARILTTSSHASSSVQEALESISTVKAFGAQFKMVSRYEKWLCKLNKIARRKTPFVALEESIYLFVLFSIDGLAFWYGTKLASNGRLASIGPVAIVLLCLNYCIVALMTIGPLLDAITKAAAGAQSLLAMIARMPHSEYTKNQSQGSDPEKVSGKIEFQQVEFSYPSRPSIKILHGIDICIEEGKTTAIVGPSGSGKSTIIGLIERWYEPCMGRILLDGRNIQSLNKAWVRSQIGLVEQDPRLFNDTIYRNVLHGLARNGQSTASANENNLVRSACEKANIHDFIDSLPEKYNTMIGERGTLLSGGQKQKIAIARAIICDPKILLLDEATSALDPLSEESVQEALNQLFPGRTTIIIAHKLSTIEKADNIIVLHEGKVTESGDRMDLIHAQGSYFKLKVAQNSTNSPKARYLMTSSQSIIEQVSENSNKSLGSNLPAAAVEQVDSDADTSSKSIPLVACIWKILDENRKLWFLFAIGALFCVFGGAMYPGQAIVYAKILTSTLSTGELVVQQTKFWALVYFLMALGCLVAFGGFGITYHLLGLLVGHTYRRSYLEAMLRQDVLFFNEKPNTSGALTARFTSDTNELQDLMSKTLGTTLMNVVSLVGAIVVALVFAWKLALVSIFGSLPPMILSGYLRLTLVAKIHRQNRELYEESARSTAETVSSIRTVASLVLEEEICDRFDKQLQIPVRYSYRELSRQMILKAFGESASLLAMGLGFWYGGTLQARGEISPFQFFVVFSAVIASGSAAGRFFALTNSLVRASAAANAIFSLERRQSQFNLSGGKQPLQTTAPIVVDFQNVCFHYPNAPEVPVLQNLNMQARLNQTLAIVGASGSGKSTIVGLLERFYDTTSGKLLIGGEPITSLEISAYRSKLSLVSQETMLYDGSIRDNILLGVPEENDEDPEKLEARLIEACKDANIHDFIVSLPEGYGTSCGNRGLSFSGGQRQRLAIARALIRDPAILILDEATSALDTASEKVVQDALRHAEKERTTITIAHRLSTVLNADHIIVLEKGRVVEEGTHGELVCRQGTYFKMCQLQGLER